MKRPWLRTLLIVLAAALVLGAVGLIAYRIGFQEGSQVAAAGLPPRMFLQGQPQGGDGFGFRSPMRGRDVPWLGFRDARPTHLLGLLFGGLVVGGVVLLAIKAFTTPQAVPPQQTSAPSSRRRGRKS